MIHNILISYSDEADYILKEYFNMLGLMKAILKYDYNSKSTA